MVPNKIQSHFSYLNIIGFAENELASGRSPWTAITAFNCQNGSNVGCAARIHGARLWPFIKAWLLSAWSSGAASVRFWEQELHSFSYMGNSLSHLPGRGLPDSIQPASRSG